MSPIFFTENVIEKAMKFTGMIHAYFSIMTLIFHSIRRFQHTSANFE
jgi:hypothetical protein